MRIGLDNKLRICEDNLLIWGLDLQKRMFNWSWRIQGLGRKRLSTSSLHLETLQGNLNWMAMWKEADHVFVGTIEKIWIRSVRGNK